MAFGIPGSETTGSAEFLGRIQYDARVGFWQTVKRAQNSDGGWSDVKSEPFRGLSFLVDFGSLEVGYINLTSPPSFLVVPEGQPIPPQPQEMSIANPGEKPRKAFQPGFRVKVASPKTFGDGDAYYFSATSKTVLTPMDDLYNRFKAAPESAQGKVPVVQVNAVTPISIKGPKGTNTYYAPVFEIIGWQDRLEVFGARTVPSPAARAPAPIAVAHAAPPANHVPPPAAAAVINGHVPPPSAPLTPAEMPF